MKVSSQEFRWPEVYSLGDKKFIPLITEVSMEARMKVSSQELRLPEAYSFGHQSFYKSPKESLK